MKNILSELRMKQGWSQQQIAELLGVSRQTINAIEKERYDPSLPLAFKIARLFDLSIEAIFQDEETIKNER
ncbi:helix-turn-helix transcriptional regulator [Acinetobacter bereziniae]|jgi:putative transcriptional regulator|uniref:helix-turn-helix transcriptional regulator n=1 Tax=Acinetobacter TaxID=469 RepID=UPI0012507842|nr:MULTISPECIES: helix-turn-helix transcriptional regulator [Acinetobacter]MBJ9904420.1 helix-turn-helix transcriptional regulator [Acinetobacter bereziniae]MBO3653656.1 helix-turn-helix transcriptional regulator [Acinetobacter bereziniae]MCM8514129.1 helix-turn-helix transcriptional regulator [Acinetobacter bereziniae]MCU4320997.1 helix-turn-helix transcriptional regulator [Acinetobacter bereziniae]MCU4536133.1 helix-turn-helix transcriptional regulator [Acinetobacter bereziniae]